MRLYTLGIRLCAVLQSWSTAERSRVYDSGTEPSKSGTLGLVQSAMGLTKTTDQTPFRRLRYGVRVNREGTLICDDRTATDVMIVEDPRKTSTVVTQRWHIADGDYLAALEGTESDLELLARIHSALLSPRNLLFLGRRNCVPTLPTWVSGGPREGSLEEVLKAIPWCPRSHERAKTLRFVVETRDGTGALRRDDPISLDPARPQYGWRTAKTIMVPTGELVIDRTWTGLPAKQEALAS